MTVAVHGPLTTQGLKKKFSIFQDLTPDEQACVSNTIKELMEKEGYDQSRAVAAAISMCSPSKVQGQGQMKAGSFSNVVIKGGQYRVTDTQDGYFVVHDVPIFSEVKKGTKGAPYDVTQEVLEEFVKTGQKRYHDGSFCATAFVRHNQNPEMVKPEFIGYVLPNRVGLYKFEEGPRWTIFGDVKMNAAAFAKAQKAELPYHSPEVPWSKRRISGLAFLDTEPPHFEYELFTTGEVTVDPSAKFNAVDDPLNQEVPDMELKEQVAQLQTSMDAVVKFMEDEKKEKEAKAKAQAEDDEKKKKEEGKMKCGKKSHMQDDDKKKPDAKPAEPEGGKKDAKMASDPEIAAKFALLADENADNKRRLDERDAKEKAEDMATNALDELKDYDLGDKTRESIASFAAQGEEQLAKFVEVVKENGKRKPPKDATDFGNMAPVDPSDPIVAKFQQQGADKGTMAAKFAGEYRQMVANGDPIKRFLSEEQYVDHRMTQEK